jgi:hypothetical protein
MRFFRGVAVVVVSLALSHAVIAGPREGVRSPDAENVIVKMVKRIVRTLGDGLTVPTPAPPPKP